MFALSFAWLSFSDLNVINAIAKARSGFEIAFTALAFVITLGIAALTMLRDLDSLYQVRFHNLKIYVQNKKQINA